jgi:hypothetical protein
MQTVCEKVIERLEQFSIENNSPINITLLADESNNVISCELHTR